MAEHKIYLLRHGPAVWEKDCHGRKLRSGPDAQLSPKGKDEIRENARKLNAQSVVFDRLISSPFTRALQTADIYSTCLAPGRQIEIDDRIIDVEVPPEWQGKTSEEIRGYRREHPELDTVVARNTLAFWRGLENDLREQEVQTLGVVSHGTPLSFLLYLFDHPDAQTAPHLDELERNKVYWLDRSEGIKIALSDGTVIGKERILTRTTPDVKQIAPCPPGEKCSA